MKKLRSWIRNYFGFSSTETNGFLILLPLMAIFIFSEPAFRWWSTHNGYIPEDNSRQLDSLIAGLTWIKQADTEQPADDSIRHLSKFDPNKISSEELTKLGLSEIVAKRIVQYRKKGGKFKYRNDLGKIYGMDSTLLKKLEPFIQLPEKNRRLSVPYAKRTSPYARSAANPIVFDLNLADTTALISVYGIGSRLSRRIVTYRNRLGGFILMDQLHEVFGLDTAVIRQLRKKSFIAPDFQPHKININLADKKELTSLPYIRFALANAIAAWRFQHGEFKSVADLKQIVLLDDSTFQKIKPYLTVND